MEGWAVNRIFSGINPGSITWGFSKAPFIWEYFGQSFEMNFLGGFVGVSQDPETRAIKPEIGWLVGDNVVIEEQHHM